MNFDILQAIFWSITYVLIIVYGIKYKVSAMPFLALILNFSWETIAIIQGILSKNVFWVHILWFSLDVVILIIYLVFCPPSTLKKMAYTFISYLASSVILAYIFTLTNEKIIGGGMLISCFSIDLIMAVTYVIYIYLRKFKINLLFVFIAITKLIGDLFAFIYYSKNIIVFILGLMVLILNLICLALSLVIYIKEKRQNNKKKIEENTLNK